VGDRVQDGRQLAKAVGIAHDAPERIQAGVLHALGAAADEGHTLLPSADLGSRAVALLEVEQAAIELAMEGLLESGDAVAATAIETDEPRIAPARSPAPSPG
jgi:exodeoxyribonuclease V alpha subunit